jgi:Uma2 family endonuclease
LRDTELAFWTSASVPKESMSAVQKPMTLDAFLAWEGRQELKHEFDGIQPVALTGGTSEHAAIQVNLIAAIRPRLRGGPCRVFGSELKIAAAGSIRYADGFVVCSPVPRGTLVITDPVIVFEILSPSTSFTDRITKNREYRQTASIRRYVILEQTSQAATVYLRAGEDWNVEVLIGDTELPLPEIGITVPLAEFYEGVEFPSDQDLAESD